MNNEVNTVCPICNSLTKKIKHLESVYIEEKLSSQFKKPISGDLKIIDYDMLKCDECGFEFASPKVEGSASFYDWVTSQPDYYVESRWEYSKMPELLARETKAIKLLDVGCGDGQFFDAITQSKNLNIDLYGLDTTIGSVEICKAKGYQVFCTDVQKFKSFYKEPLFDVITAFHVLEHIADPKSFLQDLMDLINPQGSLYISTPYSPMNFELEWFDVLNHPPHHMGRWNLKSYLKVAEILGLKIQVFMPEPQGLIKSAVMSFMFSLYGPDKKKSKIKILKSMISHPFKFLNHFFKQSKRESISGKRSSNVILVKFQKHN